MLLLIIGCTNCSILLLARGRSRERELAIRGAIGASRWQIIRQLLVEALAISFTGAVLGVMASYWLAKLPLFLAASSFPAESIIRINGPVLTLCVTLALVCGLTFGLVPALQLSRTDSARVVSSRPFSAAVSSKKHQWSALISSQVALTLVLTATAGTAVRSFIGLMQVPLGYSPSNMMKVGIMLHTHDPATWNRIKDREARTAYVERIRDRIGSVPGVVSAAAGIDGTPPYSGADRPINLEGADQHTLIQARVMLVGERYFNALGIPVLRGRSWDAEDNARGDFTAVVNQAFVKRYFGGSDPLGRQVRVLGLEVHNTYTVTSQQSTAWRQIVAVVGDVRNDGLDRSPVPAVYLPYPSVMPPYAQFFVRTQGDPLTYLKTIQTAIASIEPDQEISLNMFNGTFTLNEALERDQQYTRQRLFSVLLGVFSGMALALALVGIFSVVAYSVAQRTTEFGVRLALGSPRTHVLWVAARVAFVSTTLGVGAGLLIDGLLGTALSRWMQTSFALDSVCAASVLLVVSGLIACLLPARHAVAIPPAEALRCE